MTTTRLRLGGRLAAVLASALTVGGLVAIAPAAHADTTVTNGSLSWGFKASFRNYVGNQIAAMPPIGAAPIGERIVTTAPATFSPAAPAVATTVDEAKRPYAFPATSGTVTSATNISVPTSGGVTYNFPSHNFVVKISNPKVVVSGTTATLFADTNYQAEAGNGFPAGNEVRTQVALATGTAAATVQATSSTVAVTGVTLTAAGALAVPLYPSGEPLDDFTLTTTQQDPAQAAPAVVVSQTEVSQFGSTVVTVNGTGFTPSLATGTRPPLSGQAAGTYIAFGKFNPAWRPSTGAASTTRTATSAAVGGQKWAFPAASTGAIGGANAGAITLAPDGSFTAQIRISKAAADAAATGQAGNTQYGIYTYPGSGAVAPTYETFTPITFATTGTNVALDKAAYTGSAGSPLTVGVTVSNAATGVPTGNVQLVTVTGAGTETVVDTKPLAAGGVATLTFPSAVGNGNLLVKYVSDGTTPAASSVVASYSAKVATAIALDKAAYAVVPATTNPVVVTVTRPEGLAAPTGKVTLTYTPQGQPAVALVPLTLIADDNGRAVFQLPAQAQGTTGTISATYEGDTLYNAATTSPASTYSATGVAATVTLDKKATGYTGSVGNPIPVNVTVSGAGSSPTPTGSVTLTYTPSDGNPTALPPVALAGGKATVSIPARATAGTGTLSVAYAGDGTYVASSETSTYTVGKKATALSVVGPASVAYRTAATYTVTVSNGATGTVQVTGGGVGVLRPIANGKATFVLPANLPAGARTLRFAYTGSDQNNAATPVSKVVTVGKGATTVATAITKKWTAAKAGTLKVTVKSVKGGPAPTGKVTVVLKKGKVTKVLAGKVLKNGTVVFTLPKSAKGTWSVTTRYVGSTQHVAKAKTVNVKVPAK